MFFIPGGIPGAMPGGMPGGLPGFFGGKGKGKGWPPGDDEEGVDGADGAGPSSGEVDNKRLYELLGVQPDASGSDIKKAYHRMAMKHHPDKGGDPDTFKEVQQAFEVLSDPERRQRYDRYGEESLKEDSPKSPQDLLEQLFGGGKGGARRGGQRPKTKDHVRPLWVTLEELYTGVTRPLPITRRVLDASGEQKACETCDGRGMVVQVIQMGPMIQQMRQSCPACSGTGSSVAMKTEREVLEVFVERGAPDGHKIVFHGKANEAPGSEPGDVVVVVRQQEHPRFMRREADLYLEREVSLAEALTGFRLVVPHLDGRKLHVLSQPGEVLQPQKGGLALKAVAGAGMPIHKDPFKFGNLFLVLTIRFPQAVDPSAAAQLRHLLGGPTEAAGEAEPHSADEVEQVFAVDMDPMESAAQSKKLGGEAYEEDEDGPGMQRLDCKQQ